MLYAFFWVIPRRPNFICRRFGTLRLFQSVPKRRHIKFRRRGITQKKAYNKSMTDYLAFPSQGLRYLYKLNEDFLQVRFWNTPGYGTIKIHNSRISSHMPQFYYTYCLFFIKSTLHYGSWSKDWKTLC